MVICQISSRHCTGPAPFPHLASSSTLPSHLHLDELLVGEGAHVVHQNEDRLCLAVGAGGGLVHLAALIGHLGLMPTLGAGKVGHPVMSWAVSGEKKGVRGLFTPRTCSHLSLHLR